MFTPFSKLRLFPHMNVFENVAFPLKLKSRQKEIERRVEEALNGIAIGFELNRQIQNYLVGSISVSRLRAIINEPRVILYCFVVLYQP